MLDIRSREDNTQRGIKKGEATEMEKNLYVMDKDYCPESDAIILQGMCNGCQYYCGFVLYEGQRCVSCSYYSETEESD